MRKRTWTGGATRRGAGLVLRMGLVICGVAAAPMARAQTAPAAQVPQGSPLPRMLPAEKPKVSPAVPAAQARPPSLANPNAMVNITSVAVEGATHYGAAAFAGEVAPLHGAVKVAQIDAVRRAILDRYRADGFILTAVNASVDPQGRLRFVVTEGRIADVKLDGDIGPAGTQVLRFLNRLTEVTPIDSATLERYLLLANDVPGVTVRAVLRPSTQEPGALTLVAQVQRAAISGVLTADNRGAPFTGPEAALGLVSFNSFTEYGERTDLSLYRAFNNTQIFGQVSSEVFLGSSGLKARIYAGSGTADPSGQLRATGYHGVTTVGGLNVTYPLIRSRQQTLNVGAYFDLLESHIDTGNSPAQLASRDNIRTLRLGADYVRQDNWLGSSRGAVNSASIRLSQGLPFAGANPAHDPKAGRLNEEMGFTKVNAEITRTQTLLTFGDSSSIALQPTIAGQISGSILPTAEKFFLGGYRWDRGYYSGEVTGDNAITAAIELQYNTSFTVDVFSKSLEVGTQVYTFFDWGETWENQKTDANHRLESFGLGVRMSVARTTEINVEGVARQVRRPQGAASTTSPLTAQAIYWRVLTRF